ncbi:MAG TPA: aminotransferase class V-fold PLP-dependent enzyme [Thermoanaerobaculia bacterium]|nr:aminotransferase class V-fold PLP-dependent enzyme [Thermoanaerobaculia bacterium]
MSKYPLEPSREEFESLMAEVVRRVAEHIESLPRQPAMNTDGAADFARGLIEPLPQKGEASDALLDFLFQEAIPRSFTSAGPGYLAYVPGGGIVHAAIADFIATAVNRYVGVFAAAPALAQLEANVVRWFSEIIGYPASAGGVLTSGGSMANLTALVAARDALSGDDFRQAILYCSDQTHHSFQKAAHLAGFAYSQIRDVPSDSAFRIRIDALDESIARDRAAGLRPFLLLGSAGTTNTGAVDDLQALATVARRESMWFHVDGAYGAFFMLTERGRARLQGIEEADSLILDPHKTLFLPFGTGAVLVKDRAALRRAHSLHAEYLPAMQEQEELVDFCEISGELSRDFRGLRVWLPLKMFGAAPFRDQLDEKLDLIDYALEELRQISGVEIVAEPQLTILAFRLKRAGSDLNDLNRRLLDRINARKRVMLTSAMLNGDLVIRICIVSHRTHRDRVEMAMEDIRAAVEEV